MDLTKVVSNFVEDVDCQIWINRFEELISAKEVIIRPDGRLSIINKEDKILSPLIEKYKAKAMQMFNDEFVYFSGYTSAKYAPGAGMNMHIDSKVGEEMTVLMYPNDDYVGGELVYINPETNFPCAIKAKAGDMIYAPSWYNHGVAQVTEGNRYFFNISLLNHPM
jgi:hypothetical protein